MMGGRADVRRERRRRRRTGEEGRKTNIMKIRVYGRTKEWKKRGKRNGMRRARQRGAKA